MATNKINDDDTNLNEMRKIVKENIKKASFGDEERKLVESKYDLTKLERQNVFN